MKVPYTQLSPVALQQVVEEFVTRDGTDHSQVGQRVAQVLQQLEKGTVELHYDDVTRTCNIVRVPT